MRSADRTRSAYLEKKEKKENIVLHTTSIERQKNE